jgi:hypothetical protein
MPRSTSKIRVTVSRSVQQNRKQKPQLELRWVGTGMSLC